MRRRQFIAATSGSAVLATAFGETQMPASDTALDDIELREAADGWIGRQLQAHYGDVWDATSPMDGLFWHSPDTGTQLPLSQRGLLQRAEVLTNLPEPAYEVDAYDCEDYALRLFIGLKMLQPSLRVGVVYNFSGAHAYNLFVTAVGDVVEFEPITGEVVTDSEHEHYSPATGIVMF